MKFALLITETPEDFAARTDPEKAAAYWAGWPPYVEALYQAGVFVSGAGLEAPATATSVLLAGGAHQVQDGPISDSKEQLGGFFVIEVNSLDEALQWAARAPMTAGGVEVRPCLPPMAS